MRTSPLPTQAEGLDVHCSTEAALPREVPFERGAPSAPVLRSAFAFALVWSAAGCVVGIPLMGCAANVAGPGGSNDVSASERGSAERAESLVPSQLIGGGGGTGTLSPGGSVHTNPGVGTPGGTTSSGAPAACVAVAGGPSFCTNTPKNTTGQVIVTLVNAVSIDVCGGHTSCGTFGCDDVTGKCMTSCASTADCATGYVCSNRQCVVPPEQSAPVSHDPANWGPTSTSWDCFPGTVTCTNEDTESNNCPARASRGCDGYLCGAKFTGTTQCQTLCTSTNDCASGYVCDPCQRCIPDSQVGAGSGSCE